MGVFENVKALFGDEEEEEEAEEIIREKSKVAITSSANSEKKDITDAEVLTEEEKPKQKFTFDEKDFIDINQAEKSKKDSGQGTNKERKTEKVFRPTPVISPVYGILDKNYSKEDIAAKKASVDDVQRHKNTGEIDFDAIRKKAHGTLDDDLERELFKEQDFFADETSEQDFFETLNTSSEPTPPPETRSAKYEHKAYDGVAGSEADFQDERHTENIDEVLKGEVLVNEAKKRQDNNRPSKEQKTVQNLQNGQTEELFDLVDRMHKKEGE